MKKYCSLFTIATVLLFVCFYSFSLPRVYADSCSISANMSPTSVNVNSSTTFIFSIKNLGELDIPQIHISSGNSLWTITGGASNGWSVGVDSSSDMSFSGYSLPSGQEEDFSIYSDVGATSGDGTFTVDATTTDSSSCSVSKTVSVTSSVSPISNISVSYDSTSATISWVTSSSSNSRVDYGLSSSYGSVASDGSLTTTHSVTLNSLSASSTYHFKITSIDGNGNPVSSSDSTFTTAAAGVTTTTVVNTVTGTSKTIVVGDTNIPSVSISTSLSKPFSKAPQILGKASDDKSISRIEYSLDGGKNWHPVDKIQSLFKASTSFSFTPADLDDGNYSLKLRATDSSGNIGYSKTVTLVIDRINPQISGILYSIGPQILKPFDDGSIGTLVGIPVDVTLSAVGGPVEIKITAFNNKTTETSDFSFTKNTESGLWRGKLKFSKAGEYILEFIAKDGAGNSVKRELNKVVVENSGFITSTANEPIEGGITVYFQDPISYGWKVWDGAPYSQKNPVPIDKNGNYNLFLPAGKYYLRIESNGYRTVNSSIFELKQGEPINANFSLDPSKLLLSVGSIKLYWPDFSTQTVVFNNKINKSNLTNSMIGKTFPYFDLDSFSSEIMLGKPSLITFMNTWNPASAEQISVLDKIAKNNKYNTVVVIEGEKNSKVHVWQKIGNYSLPVVSDMDATLVSLYNLNSLPTSFFVDRKGVIKKVIGGSLSESEIIKTLEFIGN